MSQTMTNIRRNNPGTSLNDQLNAFNFPDLLESNKEAVLKALPRHMSVDRIMRIALTAFRRNDALQRCAPLSVLSAVVQASQLGLEIGQNGEAFLVPYKNECQLIPGYKGLRKLVLQSGFVTDIYAQEVRQHDQFGQTFGLHREFHHEPLCQHGFLATDEERGPVTGFYAVAVLKTGERTFVTMSAGQVNKIRDGSNGYRYAMENAKPTPWADEYTAMGLKTALRSLCNKLPMSSELRTAIALDTAANLGVSQSISLQQAADGTYEPPPFAAAYEQQQKGNMGAPSQAAAAQTRPQATRPSAAPRSYARAAAAPAAQAPASQPVAAPAAQAEAPAPSPQASKVREQQASAQPEEFNLKDVLAQMRVASTDREINDLYIKAQQHCVGRDFQELDYAFDAASKRLKEPEDMFPS